MTTLFELDCLLEFIAIGKDSGLNCYGYARTNGSLECAQGGGVQNLQVGISMQEDVWLPIWGTKRMTTICEGSIMSTSIAGCQCFIF